MNAKIRLFGVAFGLTFAFAGVVAIAQEKKPADKPAAEKPAAKPADAKAAAPKTGEKTAAGMPSAADMEKMMKAGAPGPEHAKLKPLTGKWTYVTKYRMSPDAPWTESTGTAEYKWILGDRFLAQDIKGNPDPNMGGMAFEGHGIMGYDNVAKKYTSTWMDNMSTGIMTSEGTADGSGRVFSFNTEYNCPMNGPDQHGKATLKIEGDDKVVYQMSEKGPDGKEFTGVEVTYTRTK